MKIEAMNAVIEKLFQEMWNKQQLTAADDVFAQDVIIFFAYKQSTNLKDFKQALQAWYQAFPDLHHEIDDQVASENKVATRWHGTGTHKGYFNEFAPTHKQFTYSGITIFEFNNENKIKTAWVYSDFDSILSTLLKG